MSDDFMSELDNFDGTKVPEPLVTPPEPVESTGFDEAVVQSTHDLLMAPRDSFAGLPPLGFQADPSFWEASESGFAQFGIVTGVSKWALRDEAPSYYDPEHNVAQAIESNDAYKKIVFEALQLSKAGDPGYRQLIEDLQDTTNGEQLDLVVRRIAEYKRNLQISQDSDWIPWLLGAGAGISVDVLAAAMTLNPLGMGATGANLATQTVRGARALAAGRVAAFGMAEGGGEAAAQSLTNPSIQVQDIAIATGLGGILGGTLGAAAPKFFGEVVSVEDIAKKQREMGEVLQEMEDASMGAAKRDADDFDSAAPEEVEMRSPTATTGTGSLILDKVLPNFIRTPKRRLADIIKKATKDRLKGLELNDRLTAVLSKMYKLSTQTAEDMQGQARQETMQEGLELVHGRMVVHEMRSQNIYDQFMTEAFGIGTLRNRLQNHELTGYTAQKLGTDMPTQAEFRHVADLYAQARGEQDEAGMNAALDLLRGRVPTAKSDEYVAAIKQMADHDDDWFLRFGQAEVDAGFIDPEDLGPGYRPQNWDTEAIRANLGQFARQIEELISGEPDMEFVRDAVETIGAQRADDLARQLDGDGTVSAELPLPAEGETFQEFADRIRESDPELLADILEDFDDLRQAERMEALDEIEKKLRAEEKRFGNRQVEEVLEEADVRIKSLRRRIQTATARLEETKRLQGLPSSRTDGRASFALTRQLDKEATDVGRLERRLEAEIEAVNTLRTIKRQEAELRAQIGENPAATARLKNEIEIGQEEMRRVAGQVRRATDEQKALKKRLSKLERAALRARGRKRIREEAFRIANAIAKNKSPGGFHVDDALQTSRHFKRRALNLKGVRHQKQWQDFLNNDPAMNMEIYTQAVSRQIEMRRKYLPFLRAEGFLDEGDTDVFEGLTKYLSEGLDRDMKRIGETLEGEAREAEMKRIQADYDENIRFMQQAFGEFTRSDYLKHANEKYDRYLSIAQSATTAMALGMSLLAAVADVAISLFAGTRAGAGVLDMLRPLHNHRILEAIAKDNEMMAAFMRGPRVLDNGMIVSRMDADAPSLDVPGGMLAKIQRIASSVAQVEMWTNLMHGWNRWVRGSFSIGFMRQITKDLAGYDGMRPDLKGFYAKHGIGEAEAKKMAELYSKYSTNVSGVIVPDLEAWAANGHEDLVRRFYRTLNGAGNEALLDPGLGDRPFFRSNPFGRMILQFQSFTYTAGERWFAPMVQLGMIRPTDARVLWSSMMALALASAGQTVRDYAQGREPKLAKAIETGDTQDIWRLITEAYLRSPYVTGMQGTAVDVIGTQLANPVNSAFQAISGTQGEIINPEYIRLRQGQGIFALAGPAAGMVNTGLGFGRDVLEGDFEGAGETAQARTPVLNTLPIVLMGKLVEALPGD